MMFARFELSLHLENDSQYINYNKDMSIFSKIFGRKKDNEAQEQVQVGGMEDFMTLIRVYYQSVMASQLGISNINFLPDMATFKRSLKIPTQNNKLGIAEKSR